MFTLASFLLDWNSLARRYPRFTAIEHLFDRIVTVINMKAAYKFVPAIIGLYLVQSL